MSLFQNAGIRNVSDLDIFLLFLLNISNYQVESLKIFWHDVLFHKFEFCAIFGIQISGLGMFSLICLLSTYGELMPH